MKRTVKVRAQANNATIDIEARIDSNGKLSREEVEILRDDLADRLLDLIPRLTYVRVPKHTIKVEWNGSDSTTS